jgi:hypothetical protein
MNAWSILWCMIEAALLTALIQKLRGKRVLWMRGRSP